MQKVKEDAIQTSSSIAINGLPTGSTPDMSKKPKKSSEKKKGKYSVYKGINVLNKNEINL